MNVIYLRTFFASYVLFIALCVIVIASLWWQNRKRFPEIALWLTNYLFQLIALLLVTFRGLIPDLFSIVLANFFIIGGTIILYEGLCRYVGKKTSQLSNIIMLAVFTLVHACLTYVYPSPTWRTINQSIALIYICSQASWLMLRGTHPSWRSATRATGVVFIVFCMIGLIQVIVNLTIHESHYVIISGSFGIVATMMYQISFVALTFTLFLMVSRRLSMDLEKEMVQRGQEDRIMRLRLSLLEFATIRSLEEVLRKTLDEVGELMESPVGFYHFVDEDQKTLTLQTWSTRTQQEFCKAAGKGMYYNIDQAGVWVDCVHQKRAVIHNDYYSLPHRKGLPEGHAPVIRELVVPILRGGKVMAILGIGNKPTYYTEKDAETVSYLADVAWEIIKHKKAEEAVNKYSNDLKERLKELNCLYSMSEIVQRNDLSLDEILKECPAIISQAYQFPEITACRIILGDRVYSTTNFRETPWAQNRKIIIHDGEQIGTIEVCYLEKRAKEYDGPFLVEECNLLEAVADILGRSIESKQAEEQIRHLATHDLLTDLPSMRLAMDRLTSALNMAHRYKKSAAVMFIDLDGFKSVNDTLGHDAGDYVLKQVAQRMLACVRETDTVARVGGDEFLIIATEIISADNAAQIAQKVIQTVSQPIFINGEQAVVGTSIGIALFPDHSEDMDRLIKLADEAMYKVKNDGKNGYRFVNT